MSTTNNPSTYMFIAVSCESLGHLLQHVVDGNVLLEGQAGDVVIEAADCTAPWSKMFWQL